MTSTAPTEPAGDLADRRVLIIEDDPMVCEVAETYLRNAGFLVNIAADSFAGLDAVATVQPDLIVLDRLLPGIDGVEVCRRIRQRSQVPVIMLTALGDAEDRIDGLEAGADDYLAKPFSPRELVLRVQSVLRRSLAAFAPEAPFDLGVFWLDPSARIVTAAGVPLELSTREFDLFSFLLKHPRQTFDRQTLLRAVWGWEFGDLSTVTVTMRRLREKIEADPGHPQILVTVWGVGYRLDLEADMPIADFLAIVAMALGSALVVGALGLLALRFLRRRALIVQLCVIVLASVLSLAAGVLAVALAMYISPHDFLVVVTVTIVAAIVSVGVALLLGLRIARAGNELRRLTHAMGEGSLVDQRPSASPSSEFVALASELAETSRRLAQARDDVQAIDASRRELVAWVSHDLRSPLSGLRAMTEALEDGLAADPARFHRQMRLQVDRLTSLVDNLFELSKISSGTLVLNLEPLSLHDLVSDAAAELAAVAQAKSIMLIERTSPDHTLVGDPRELSRVVSNLLMNALEHTPTGGEVHISTVQDTEGVTLSVRDSGAGIAESDLHRIFDPGWRGTRARTPVEGIAGTSGAGLGLAIVRGIVEAHQGRISATNEPTGCRFDVRLPHGAVA